jgi:hypothetical protein
MKQNMIYFYVFALLSGYSITAAAADVDIVRDRRLASIVSGTTGATSIATW